MCTSLGICLFKLWPCDNLWCTNLTNLELNTMSPSPCFPLAIATIYQLALIALPIHHPLTMPRVLTSEFHAKDAQIAHSPIAIPSSHQRQQCTPSTSPFSTVRWTKHHATRPWTLCPQLHPQYITLISLNTNNECSLFTSLSGFVLAWLFSSLSSSFYSHSFIAYLYLLHQLCCINTLHMATEKQSGN